MNKYICKCGYEIESDTLLDDFVCPKCGAKKDSFKESEKLVDIIDSMLDEVTENETQKIINDDIHDKKIKIDPYNPAIVRIIEKCINCGQCKKTCENIVNLKYNLKECKNPICLGCGQCLLNCPTGAIIPRYCYHDVKRTIISNEKIVVGIISPAVRVALGEMFNLKSGDNVEKKIVTALKKLGFDYVFDTAFGADLTIMEEVTEFAKRLKEGLSLPQFTSCCPAWVKYAEIYHPELLENISTCKSPIGMQCSIIKSYFAEEKNIEPSKIVTVAITPCTSKKMEAKEYTPNIDYVMTTSELGIFLKEEEINLAFLEDSEYDNILGDSSGAGVIFGNSGGVTESTIRTLYRMLTGENLRKEELKFSDLRGFKGIKEATIKIQKYVIKVAVIQQMENLEAILKDNYYKKFHFIEVMNCKGGCIGGGGQPLCAIPKIEEIREQRSEGLYKIDQKRTNKFAHNNKELKVLYKKYLKNPLGEKSMALLHTSYSDKSGLLNEKK